MSHRISTSAVPVTALAAVTATWAVAGLPYAAVLAGAVAATLLVRFSGCATPPPSKEWYECQVLSLELEKKYDEMDKLVKALVDEVGWNIPVVGGPSGAKVKEIGEKMGKLNDRIKAEGGRLREEILRQADAAKKRQEVGGAIKRRLDSAAERTELRLAGFEGLQPRFVGLDEFRSQLTEALAGVDELLSTKLGDLEAAVDVVDLQILPAAAEIERNAALFEEEDIGLYESLVALEALDTATDDLHAAALDLIGLELAEGTARLDRLTELIRDAEPGILVHRPEGKAAMLHLRTDISLDAATLGPLADGSVVTLELPQGLTLTRPLAVTPSGTLTVNVAGNHPGSCAVAIEITSSSGTDADVLRVRANQEIAVAPGAPCAGEARVRNLGTGRAVTIPVAAVSGAHGQPRRGRRAKEAGDA